MLVIVMIAPTKDKHITLGLPVFSAFFVMADLQAATLTFKPGCGCARRLDQYPKFFIDEKPVCTCSPFPDFNFNAGETSPNATTTTVAPADPSPCTCQNSVFEESYLPNSATTNPISWLLLWVTLMHFL
jgi:hypothetical protein